MNTPAFPGRPGEMAEAPAGSGATAGQPDAGLPQQQGSAGAPDDVARLAVAAGAAFSPAGSFLDDPEFGEMVADPVHIGGELSAVTHRKPARTRQFDGDGMTDPCPAPLLIIHTRSDRKTASTME